MAESTKRSKQPSDISRRQFSQAAAGAFGAAAGFHFFPSLAQKRLEKPALAGIGAGGKGQSDIQGAAEVGFEIVALVDVIDATKLSPGGDLPKSSKLGGRLNGMGELRQQYEDAAYYSDYREMLADLGDRVDAVTVSTPDHHHLHASALAMLGGKHVYCQKPLTHGIGEARLMAEIAARTGMKTQMGNQAHAHDHMRRCAELIRAGAVGKVQEIHAWTNRPIWPQGFASPPAKQPVPAGIDWEQWIGPAPWVDYSPLIAPFNWRGWWDYGTGALGDMACHIMDLGYWAMLPGAPRQVTAKQAGATELSPPINSVITWDFGPGPNTDTSGFKFYWYDGYIDAKFDRDDWQLVKNGNEYNHPGPEVMDDASFQDYGSVVIGSEGKLFFNRGSKTKQNWLLKRDTPFDAAAVPQSLPRATDQDNYRDWLDAIEGKIDQPGSNFSLAGPMTETILLGVLAQRFPDRQLVWDHERLEIVGRPELKSFISRPYRQGWELSV